MQKRETVDTTRFTSNFFWETNFWMTTGSRRILLTIWFSDKVFFLSSSNCKCCWAIFASANWSSSCLCLKTFSTCFKKKSEKSYMYLCPYSLVLFQHKKNEDLYTAQAPSTGRLIMKWLACNSWREFQLNLHYCTSIMGCKLWILLNAALLLADVSFFHRSVCRP